MIHKTKTRVTGLVNGTADDSIFSENPKGWFQVTVEIDMNLDENKNRSIEDLFLEHARKKISFMFVAHETEVKIESSKTELKGSDFIIDEDF
jgi:hypothetical protein